MKAIHVHRIQSGEPFSLGLELIAGEGGLQRSLSSAVALSPGLRLAGIKDDDLAGTLQVMGPLEVTYLQSLTQPQRIEVMERLEQAQASALIFSDAHEPCEHVVQWAAANHLPVFTSPLHSDALIAKVNTFLEFYLTPKQHLHGVLLDVYGVGVLLTGHSGIGKSECALDLVMRGHRLVSDDVVVVTRSADELTGRGTPLTRHHMEIRGLGIINVRDLFGAASVRETKRIELLVELQEWQQGVEFERLGIDDHCESILGVALPKVQLPIRPGRNVASIVEVASRNHLLKMQGHHSARNFAQVLEQQLQGNAGQ